MTASPKVTVIVPHYNDLAGLDVCLSALSDQQGIPRDDYEIIVGDNGTPGGIDKVRQLVAGRAEVVEAKERGAGPARNAAVAKARGEVLAFTDSDCVPEAGWLAAGLGHVQPGVIVGGCMKVSVSDENSLSGPEAFERVFAFNNRRYVERLGFTVTANLFCTAKDFQKVGPFRTGVSEDKEWCDRARRLGLEVRYAPNATVAHPARKDWAALRAKWLRIDRETYLLNQENGGGPASWITRAWLIPLSIIPHAIRCLRSDSLQGWSSRFAAIGTLAKLRIWRFWHYHSLLSGAPRATSGSKRDK